MIKALPVISSLGWLLFAAIALPAFCQEEFKQQIEADWLLQAEVRFAKVTTDISPDADAMGGCDGVKTGQWGFHTRSVERPWWQVDLGAGQILTHAVLWNRCDATASRNNHILILCSQDGRTWQQVYAHDGTLFGGFSDGKPLRADFAPITARFVRLQLPGTDYLHLDEVEVYGAADPARNIALGCPATQINTSPWSIDHRPKSPIDWTGRVQEILHNCERLLAELAPLGHPLATEQDVLRRFFERLADSALPPAAQDDYVQARWLQRRLTLAMPSMDFNQILFAKRVPGSYSHMSDQYYGWWSRPGGGLFLLRGFRGEFPETECVTAAFAAPGSFLRPTLDYEAKKVLFAWCKHYPGLAGEPNKLDKANVPEDAFYHLFEMNLDGTGLRQLTRGKYDDFDGRYLPGGNIVFLSTRRGQLLQCGPDSARVSCEQPDRPDAYVRCGGGPERPVAVYTLHTMDADGKNIAAISPFEMFEWTPSIAHDGTILYSRWDYIDRHNMPYMSLWSMYPNGANARIVYGNYTLAPHCTFEPECIPGSSKIVFTGSGHHAQTMGSLVLLDPAAGSEGPEPITRLTPEVVFPEIEGWPKAYFANPWPLSERFYLVSWGVEENIREGSLRPENGMGIYLFDAQGNNLELLYRDPAITCESPLSVRPRPRPPLLQTTPASQDGPPEGRFLLTDVYQGLKEVPRGDVKALRIVAVPPKTHPTMNNPRLGITGDDPGKCVLGTVPVASDGSAYFRVPASVILFFQALDAQGRAIQTMRGATYAQPGQTVSCSGCHESRHSAPIARRTLAGAHPPAGIALGPEGSWPIRFDRLIQPMLDDKCVDCHRPGYKDKTAARLDLRPKHAYDALINFGQPSLAQCVREAYVQGYSAVNKGIAQTSPLWKMLSAPEAHYGVRLDHREAERWLTWMDTYAQYLGAFSVEQEDALADLKKRYDALFTGAPPAATGKVAQAPAAFP